MHNEDSQNFQRDEVRETVIPAYMGLVKQIDDHIGRLSAFLKEQGRYDDTLIVFTSDHGDYLGDHWLGEKDLFHEESVRIPLIVRDPDGAADTTRGQRDARLVEAIVGSGSGRTPSSVRPIQMHMPSASRWAQA